LFPGKKRFEGTVKVIKELLKEGSYLEISKIKRIAGLFFN